MECDNERPAPFSRLAASLQVNGLSGQPITDGED